jgi:hypothetical protein
MESVKPVKSVEPAESITEPECAAQLLGSVRLVHAT